MGKKVIDESAAYKILTSNITRDVKLRQLSQLQYGNRKLGTMGAKQMYTNYLNKMNKQPQSQTYRELPRMTPEQQEQLNSLVSMFTKSVDKKEEEEEEIDMDVLSNSVI